jgi:hypothetical protein
LPNRAVLDTRRPLPADGHPRYIAAGKSCVVGKELEE